MKRKPSSKPNSGIPAAIDLSRDRRPVIADVAFESQCHEMNDRHSERGRTERFNWTSPESNSIVSLIRINMTGNLNPFPEVGKDMAITVAAVAAFLMSSHGMVSRRRTRLGTRNA